MTSEVRAYVPGWVVEKLFENGYYGVNIKYFQHFIEQSMKTVNKEAYEKRIKDAVEESSTAIETSWNAGRPKVILEVSSDIYHKVKDTLFQDIEELALTRIGVTEGFSSITKKGTTKFAVTNKNY